MVKKTPKENSTINKANQSVAKTEIGNANGIAGSQSTQGNAKVSTSLGAGYEKAMQGRCSDLSNEADDEGRVSLLVNISATGKATDIQITHSSGIKRLDNEAKRMQFTPAKLNGQAVSDTVSFTIHFKCGNSAYINTEVFTMDLMQIFAHQDLILSISFSILVLMSIISWSIILLRLSQLFLAKNAINRP